MSEPADPVEAPEAPESTPQPVLADRLGVFGRIDRLVYRAEVVTVVTALVLMSVTVFTDVAYQTAVGLSLKLEDGSGFLATGLILAFVAMMGFAAMGPALVDDQDAEAGDDDGAAPLPKRLAVAAASAAGVLALGAALLHLESSTVYRLVLIALSFPVVRSFVRSGDRQRLIVYCIASVVALWGFGRLPGGFSWSQSYSLVMLLWVGFLGASIAARERRHLRVDLVRKLLGPGKLPLFNAISYTVAASFTAIVLYLGYTYMFGANSSYLRPIWEAPTWLPQSMQETLTSGFPLPEDAGFFRRLMQVVFAPSEPGEIPDWLKVAAIPASMLLIAARFFGHAIVFAKMAIAGEEFTETTGTH